MSDFPEVKDHLVANPDKYTMTTNPDGTVTLRPTWVDNPSEVLQEGTPVDAAFLSKIPEAIDAIDEKVTSQLADIAINVKEYGAIGDGQSHPLSEKFATLAAAQVVYPAALSLNDEIDAVAIQKALDSVAKKVYVPAGTYLINRTLRLNKTVTVEGSGRRTTSFRYTGTELEFRVFEIINVSHANFLKFRVSNTAKKGIAFYLSAGYNAMFDEVSIGSMNVGIFFADTVNWISYINKVSINDCLIGIFGGWNFNAINISQFNGYGNDVCIDAGEGRTINVVNSHFEGGRIGVIKRNSGDINIENSYFEANTDNHIQIVFGSQSVDRVKVDGCSFHSAENQKAIVYHALQTATILLENNTFTNNNGVTSYAVGTMQYTLANFRWVNNKLSSTTLIMDSTSEQKRLLRGDLNPVVVASSTDDATSTTDAPLRSSGGLGVVKKSYFGDKAHFADSSVHTKQGERENVLDKIKRHSLTYTLAEGQQLKVRFTLTDGGGYMVNIKTALDGITSADSRLSLIEKTLHFKLFGNALLSNTAIEKINKRFAVGDCYMQAVGSGNQVELIVKYPTGTTLSVTGVIDIEVLCTAGSAEFVSSTVV